MTNNLIQKALPKHPKSEDEKCLEEIKEIARLYGEYVRNGYRIPQPYNYWEDIIVIDYFGLLNK